MATLRQCNMRKPQLGAYSTVSYVVGRIVNLGAGRRLRAAANRIRRQSQRHGTPSSFGLLFLQSSGSQGYVCKPHASLGDACSRLLPFCPSGMKLSSGHAIDSEVVHARNFDSSFLASPSSLS